MKTDELTYIFRPSMELWIIHGKLVAQQQSYVPAFMKENAHEVRHYMCPNCGDEWGKRIDPKLTFARHHFYSKPCLNCGGKAWNMLTPWEQEHLDILGPNVLAYLILTETEEEVAA